MILALIAAATGLFGQEPAGAIEGSVRDATSKAPLADVEISLTSRGLYTSARTNAAGVFRFEHLAGGDYQVRYNKPGYLGSSVTGTGKSVSLKDGAVTERLTIDLTPIAGVEGVVLDEEGRPMKGVLVHSPNGNGPSTTDEEGRYHLEILIPRRNRIELRVPYELRRASLKRDPETGETFGYANTQYYPGVFDPLMAGAVDFAPGVHLHGFDIRLRRTRLVELSGYAVDMTDGQEPSNLEIELSPEGSPLPDETYQRRPAGAGGAFRFDLIQPGRYTLAMYRGTEHSALPYVTTVDVPKTGIRELKVSVPAFVQIRGIIATAKPGQGWSGQVRISLRDKAAPGLTREFVSNGESDLWLDAIPPGRWLIEVTSSTKPLTVTGVRIGSQQGPEPILIAESGNPPLEITLSDQTGTVAGTVVDEHLQPVKGALIVVRQPGGSIFGRFLHTGVDGSFRAADLPPGQYEVSAWVDSGPGIDSAPKGSGHAAKVEVKAGETALVRLVW